MTISNHIASFMGLPVGRFKPKQPLPDPTRHAVRVAMDEEQYDKGPPIERIFAELLARPECERITALVIGPWSYDLSDSSAGIVEALIAAKAHLPRLAGIFLGDMITEECEVSWMHQTDLGPLMAAYPGLREFVSRGGDGLRFTNLRHGGLRSLTVQSGGLPAAAVRDIAGAELPALERIELWLGSDNYGGDSTTADLAPILSGKAFPRLLSLGLCDSQQADEIAKAVAQAPILARIESLDLSMGTLGDEGAEALLASPHLTRLKRLNLRHHYLGDETMGRLLKTGVAVNLDDRVDEEDYGRTCEVAE